MKTQPPTLTLFTESLFSKWGFNDGDLVGDFLLEHLEDDLLDGYSKVDEHRALRFLVRAYLLPALAAGGADVEVYDIETIHNPVRARAVNGVELDAGVEYGEALAPRLQPEHVDVPLVVVLRAAGLEVVPGEVVEYGR